MIDVIVSIWIASKTRWVHLEKSVSLPCVPRVGEYIKFESVQDDYIPWKVIQITHREDNMIEVWTELLDNIDNRMYSFDNETEFDEFYNDFLSAGWTSPKGITKNTRYKSKN